MLLLGGGRKMEMGATTTTTTTMTMTRVARLSLCCCRAEKFEGRCARRFGSRKIRVVRIGVIRGDRHMTVDVPSSIARMLFRSLECKKEFCKKMLLIFFALDAKDFALRRTRGSRNIDLESADGNAKGREDDVQAGTSCFPLLSLSLALLSSRVIIVLVDNVRDLYISAA